MTSCGIWPPVEDNFLWKTTLSGRWPSVEYDLWWKTTFSGSQPLVEDDLCWKTTFRGRPPLVEDDLWWQTNKKMFYPYFLCHSFLPLKLLEPKYFTLILLELFWKKKCKLCQIWNLYDTSNHSWLVRSSASWRSSLGLLHFNGAGPIRSFLMRSKDFKSGRMRTRVWPGSG